MKHGAPGDVAHANKLLGKSASQPGILCPGQFQQSLTRVPYPVCHTPHPVCCPHVDRQDAQRLLPRRQVIDSPEDKRRFEVGGCWPETLCGGFVHL